MRAIVDDTFPSRPPRFYTDVAPSLRVGGGGFKVVEYEHRPSDTDRQCLSGHTDIQKQNNGQSI